MSIRPRNQRLDRAVYRDPERVTFFTIRATEDTSPFATVRHNDGKAPVVEFQEGLCQQTLACLWESKEKLGCDVLVACLMPDHLHLMARPRTHAADVLTLVDQFKGKATNGSWEHGHDGRLWQPRSYDHVLRHEESVLDAAEYIALNPVRKQYVLNWEDWPYTVRWDAGAMPWL